MGQIPPAHHIMHDVAPILLHCSRSDMCEHCRCRRLVLTADGQMQGRDIVWLYVIWVLAGLQQALHHGGISQKGSIKQSPGTGLQGSLLALSICVLLLLVVGIHVPQKVASAGLCT